MKTKKGTLIPGSLRERQGQVERWFLFLASATLAITALGRIVAAAVPSKGSDPADSGNGETYFARGNLESVLKSGTNDPGNTNRYGFYVEVIGESYKVRIEEASEGNNRYYEYAFAGGEMRLIHHSSGAQVLRASGMRTNDSPPRFPARVELREIPPPDGTRAGFVWFALASAAYLKDRANDFLLPIWSPEDPNLRRQPFAIRSIVEPLDIAPHLPRQVVFLNDGTYRSYNPASKTNDVIPLPEPYAGGYTNAIYQVLDVTNCGALLLPSRFVFAVYSTPFSPGHMPFERLMVSGWVEMVGATAPEGALLKPFEGEASVADYRLNGQVDHRGKLAEYNYVAYPITNGSWPASNELHMKRAHHEQALRGKLEIQSADGSPSSRWIVRLVLLLCAIAPVVALGYRTFHRTLQR